MLSLIGMVITGVVPDVLVRLTMRSEQSTSTLWTITLGAVGAFIGDTVASFFGIADTSGIDWIRWVSPPVAAIGVISAYLKLAGCR